MEWGGDREALRGWDEGRWLLQGRRPGSALWLHLPWGRPELRMTWEGLPVSGGGRGEGLFLLQDDPLPKVISGTQKSWVQREAV